MKNDNGFDLSGLEKFSEDSSPSGEELKAYEESLRLIKEAMSHVIQEILLTLPDGSAHMVYVNGIKMSETVRGEVEVEFSTPSTERKDELYPHVEDCIKMQLTEHFAKKPKKSWFK
ncbi:head vertex assembly chaperone [Erwinia phage Cronus]|uniref:Head assembly protein n=1 Tax=Erwinia phage Cronus TaxID=2163633 RepID=A0A2S1GM64_9CAUD|nr:head vertex assembly chaperone [Erwinia phage Cronus]AWD90472.1 head assembly protein [Erwinia phage Cronus]